MYSKQLMFINETKMGKKKYESGFLIFHLYFCSFAWGVGAETLLCMFDSGSTVGCASFAYFFSVRSEMRNGHIFPRLERKQINFT
jgi:hypothetical protein